MKIQVLSDLHNEFEAFQPNEIDADVIILAGDIDIKARAINWAKDTFPDTPVIYVLGNHEYYKSAYPKILKKTKDLAKDTHIHVLENDHIKIDDVNFLGCTLWTDFRLFGNQCVAGYHAQTSMNDYKKIRLTPGYKRLSPMDTSSMHRNLLNWLKEKLEELKNETVVIVTHHAPSLNSVPEDYKTDLLSAAYASNLDDFVSNSNAKLWIHGHMHTASDYTLGNKCISEHPLFHQGHYNKTYD